VTCSWLGDCLSFCVRSQCGCVCDGQVANSAELETVKLSSDARGFSLHPSGKRFVPWGHNYASVDNLERLANDPADVEREFAEKRAAGTTVARIHPEMSRLLAGPEKADPVALDQMRRLLKIASQSGHPSHGDGSCLLPKSRIGCRGTMRWTNKIAGRHRRSFGKRLQRRVPRAQPFFAYDLINEPAASARKPAVSTRGIERWVLMQSKS